AVKVVPPIIDRMEANQHLSYSMDTRAKEFQDRRRGWLARATTLRAELDQRRRDEGTSDALTDRYFASRWETAAEDTRYFGELADYYAALARKHRRAAWFPWATVPRDSPPPPDPFSSRAS